MLERQAIDRGAILYDPRRVAEPGPWMFDPERHGHAGAVSAQSGGRGSILYIDRGAEHWVLRRYLRGGLAAQFARDRYLWLGEEGTRSFRELRLLAELRRRDQPVPEPVAARYLRGFASYTAALITARLPGARSLSEVMAKGQMDDARWAAIGRCLRHFHDAGVQHADLNAHNIMLGERREVWLLDFDRGRLRRPGRWRERVLDRLARSLAKIGAGAAGWRTGFALLRLAHDA